MGAGDPIRQRADVGHQRLRTLRVGNAPPLRLRAPGGVTGNQTRCEFSSCSGATMPSGSAPPL